MKKLAALASLSVMSVCLAACGDHYDKDGHYVSFDTNGRTVVDTDGNRTYFADPESQQSQTPYTAYPPQTYQTVTETYAPTYGAPVYAPGPGADVTTTRTVTTYGFTKPGYYDSNGTYVTIGEGPAVPHDMMPPAGLCRVWYPGYALQAQPGVQSCAGIRAQVPPGAYVLFGG